MRSADVVDEELRARDEPDGRLRGCVSSSDCRLSTVGLGVEVDYGSQLRSETNRGVHDGALFIGERSLETKWRRMDELHKGKRMGLRNKQTPWYTLTYRTCSGSSQSVCMWQGEALHHWRKPRLGMKGAGRGFALAEVFHYGRKSRLCPSPAHLFIAE